MIEKLLTQQAKELGVSLSYLSQVRHGKILANKRVAEVLGAQLLDDVKQTLKQKYGGSILGGRTYLSALQRI